MFIELKFIQESCLKTLKMQGLIINKPFKYFKKMFFLLVCPEYIQYPTFTLHSED